MINFQDKIRNIGKFYGKADKNILLLIVIFMLLTPIFLTPVIYGYDGSGYYVYLRSTVIDKDLDLENEYAHYKEKFPYINVGINPETGKVLNQYTIGTPLLWSPFFLIAHGASIFFGTESDGYSPIYSFSVTMGSVIYMFLGLIMLYNLVSYFVSNKFISMLSVIVFWLSSHMFYYTFLQPSMSHAVSFFTVSLMIYWWFFKIRNHNSLNNWAIFGFISGISFLVRMQNSLYLSIPLIFFISDIIKSKDFKELINNLKGPIISSLTFFLTLIPQFFIWKIFTDHYISAFSNYGTSNTIKFNLINILNVIFSNRHGLFNWTPVFLLGFIGLLMIFKKNKKLFSSFFVAIILQVIITASWIHWWAGHSYGNRYLMGTGIFFTIGLAFLFNRLYNHNKWAVWIISTSLVLWNFNLMLQYGSRIICGDCSASPLEIIKNTFTKVIPRLKNIIYNFLFNKDSFLSS